MEILDLEIILWLCCVIRMTWLCEDHTHTHTSLFLFHSLSRASFSLSQTHFLLPLLYGPSPKPIQSSQIEGPKATIVFVRSRRVDWYPFQVRKLLRNLWNSNPDFMHCSCSHKTSIFREFQAHRELKEVFTKLGVLRLKDLDVGITRTGSFNFGRNFQGFFRRVGGRDRYGSVHLCEIFILVQISWKMVQKRGRNHVWNISQKPATVAGDLPEKTRNIPSVLTEYANGVR